MTQTDVLILGAGAAGLMCAAAAGQRGRRVTVIDHSTKIAEKIRISGGGRCNFTNIHCATDRFISQNPHFATSALQRYTQHDFIALVEKHGIAYHEKTLGQLFCNHSANDIITMLLDECSDGGATIQMGTTIGSIIRDETGGFTVETSHGPVTAQSLVIATGGPSIPKIGATGFGYDVARQFGLDVIAPRAALVPLTFDADTLELTRGLSGVAVDPTRVSAASGKSFDEAMLFTHRGLSGPAILQISSYWQPGESIEINLAPHIDVLEWLRTQRNTQSKAHIHNILSELLPKRLAQAITDDADVSGRIAELPNAALAEIANTVSGWRVRPVGSEGYRTAEVALGGVNTDELSSKTFAAHKVPNLYFIGEVVDVTGHLGGFNFQWAWSSGWCAGQYV